MVVQGNVNRSCEVRDYRGIRSMIYTTLLLYICEYLFSSLINGKCT